MKRIFRTVLCDEDKGQLGRCGLNMSGRRMAFNETKYRFKVLLV